MSTLQDFKRIVARTDAIPRDLEALAQCTLGNADSPFAQMGLRALLPGEQNGINDTSWLSRDELDDPDIQSNLVAIRRVSELSRFVAQDEDRNLYGYWLGDGRPALDGAPILMFSNEGVFSLLPGASLAEATACQYASEHEPTFLELKQRFAALGILFGADSCVALVERDPAPAASPARFHLLVYNAERIKRGLDPLP